MTLQCLSNNHKSSIKNHWFQHWFKFHQWVTHDLTQKDKDKWKQTCVNFLEYQRMGDCFNRIVTCCEKWVYYDNTVENQNGLSRVHQ